MAGYIQSLGYIQPFDLSWIFAIPVPDISRISGANGRPDVRPEDQRGTSRFGRRALEHRGCG